MVLEYSVKPIWSCWYSSGWTTHYRIIHYKISVQTILEVSGSWIFCQLGSPGLVWQKIQEPQTQGANLNVYAPSSHLLADITPNYLCIAWTLGAQGQDNQRQWLHTLWQPVSRRRQVGWGEGAQAIDCNDSRRAYTTAEVLLGIRRSRHAWLL